MRESNDIFKCFLKYFPFTNLKTGKMSHSLMSAFFIFRLQNNSPMNGYLEMKFKI